MFLLNIISLVTLINTFQMQLCNETTPQESDDQFVALVELKTFKNIQNLIDTNEISFNLFNKSTDQDYSNIGTTLPSQIPAEVSTYTSEFSTPASTTNKPTKNTDEPVDHTSNALETIIYFESTSIAPATNDDKIEGKFMQSILLTRMLGFISSLKVYSKPVYNTLINFNFNDAKSNPADQVPIVEAISSKNLTINLQEQADSLKTDDNRTLDR